MKIALLTDGIYPYVMGGMQKHSYYLVKYFARNGIYVDLYHTNQSKELDINKLEIFSDEEKKYIRSFVIDFPKIDNFPGHYIRESYQYSVKIFDALKNNPDVDFIYVKGFSGWKLIEEKKNSFKCPPIGIKFHGMEMFQKSPSFKSLLSQYLLRRPVLFNLENANYVFSYGGKITELKLKLKIPKSKIIEIPTGIESAWLNDSVSSHVSEVRKFVFIGRYERRKGIEELQQVLRQIDNFDFEFYFIGPIPEDKRILSSKIKYLGSMSDQEVIKRTIRDFDVLVCPSYSEGMPNVILEAMASGLAVIATDVGAVRELVSENTGWLIDTGKDEIKKAMLEAMRCSKDELVRKKTNSKKHIQEHFLWENIILETINKIGERI